MYRDAHVRSFSLMSTSNLEQRIRQQLFTCPWFYKPSQCVLLRVSYRIWNIRVAARRDKRYIKLFQNMWHFRFFSSSAPAVSRHLAVGAVGKKCQRNCRSIQFPRGELNSVEQRFIHRDNANSHSWSIRSREGAVRGLSAEHAKQSPGTCEQKLTVGPIYLHWMGKTELGAW